jgi:hypothetical protein
MPRSMRFTAAKPQFLAMSVAFELQGDIVPRRGVTSSSSPAGGTGNSSGNAQQILEPRCFGVIQRCVELDEIPVFGVQPKAGRASPILFCRRARRDAENAEMPRRARNSAMMDGPGRVGGAMAIQGAGLYPATHAAMPPDRSRCRPDCLARPSLRNCGKTVF